MKISYFPKSCALNSHSVMEAFLTSCRRAGIATVENSLDADVAVIWSVTWAGRLAENQKIYRHYRQHRRPVIVLEVGALQRGVTWKVAVNNITADGYYGHLENLDPNRPQKLGMLNNCNRIASNDGVLLVMQNSRSLQVEHLQSIDQWAVDVVQQLQNYTDRKITIRPHPRSTVDLSAVAHLVTVQQPCKLPDTYDSFDINYGYHAVINYNSGAGVQAAVAGAAVIVDQSSLAAPVGTQLKDVEQPTTADRSQWLVEIAHTEYLLDEIKKGLWIQRLATYLPL